MRTSSILLLLVALAAACGGPGTAPGGSGGGPGGPDVLLIVLDTVRGDRLSCYGHDRPTSPNIDALAGEGIRFTHAYANAGWTLPSHATMFNGTYTVGHGASQETLELGSEMPTLAEILDEAGYATFGASTNGVVSRKSGLARGFDEFVEGFRTRTRQRFRGGRLDSPNNMSFKAFLDDLPADRPFFAFLNYIDAHLPYTPPARHRERVMDSDLPRERIQRATKLGMPDHYMNGSIRPEDFAVLGQLYDAEISQVDEKVGELLEILASSGRERETLVVLTSDHGENLGEHGHFAHVFSIHEPVLRIPLIIRLPDGSGAGTLRTDRAQLVDLFPTILSAAGVDHAGRMDGRDLLAPGAEAATPGVLAEYYYPRQVLSVFDPEDLERHLDRFLPYMRRIRSLSDGTMKLIRGSDGRNELYDMSVDAGETLNLLGVDASHPDGTRLESRMRSMLDAHAGPVPVGPPPPPGWKMPGFEEVLEDDPELLERLRSLGYVQ